MSACANHDNSVAQRQPTQQLSPAVSEPAVHLYLDLPTFQHLYTLDMCGLTANEFSAAFCECTGCRRIMTVYSLSKHGCTEAS